MTRAHTARHKIVGAANIPGIFVMAGLFGIFKG
jgi:hypothetical protein